MRCRWVTDTHFNRLLDLPSVQHFMKLLLYYVKTFVRLINEVEVNSKANAQLAQLNRKLEHNARFDGGKGAHRGS